VDRCVQLRVIVTGVKLRFRGPLECSAHLVFSWCCCWAEWGIRCWARAFASRASRMGHTLLSEGLLLHGFCGAVCAECRGPTDDRAWWVWSTWMVIEVCA